MALVGFLVNPIAGMGGRVGLKGTDEMASEARRKGAEPIARSRAMVMLRTLRQLLSREPVAPVEWITCAGEMGAELLTETGFVPGRVLALPAPGQAPSAGDTKAATAEFLASGVDLILFCGGDGTARDVASVADRRVPLLGIPSGVKMYSGVFGASPSRTADILLRFLKGELHLAETEILDLDEEKYRAGEWVVRLYQVVLTPFEPSYTQLSKQLISEESDSEAKSRIADYIAEMIRNEQETLFILGPGSTVAAVAGALGVRKTLLGIDAVRGGAIVGEDMSEQDILALLDRHPRCKLVLGLIGAQGFVVGRGNLQLSPRVLRRIGPGNLIVVATPAKLALTPVLRVDTGDSELDAEIAARRYLPVVDGYRHEKLVRIQA
jgi:predicted polyphosphate/ATP-dependent NAD kinase